MPLPVIISYSNYGYKDFALNLIKNVSSVIEKHQFVFYCIDQEIYDYLQPYATDRIIIERFNSISVANTYQAYNTSDFCKITAVKLDVVRHALTKYKYIHFVDGDIVFCKEPTEEYYAHYAEYDIVFQLDAPPPNPKFDTWVCTGNWILRDTPGTYAHLTRIHSRQQQKKTINDQEAQREIFRLDKIKDIRKYKTAKLYEFPMEEFTCGYLVRENMVDVNKIMVFHANHVRGSDAKKGLLKKIGKWYLDA